MRDVRKRLERERSLAALRLRQLGGSITLEETVTPADSVWDEADHIQASEQREVLRVALRSIGDAVITTDTGGFISYMNGVAESLTGWSLADAAGRPLDTVVSAFPLVMLPQGLL